MSKVNMDGIPLRVLTEVNSSINNMAGIGMFTADVHVPNQYLIKVMKVLELTGYKIENLGSDSNADMTKLRVDFNEPLNLRENSFGNSSLDCAVWITEAEHANNCAKKCKEKRIPLLLIIGRTKHMKKKGYTLKEHTFDVSNILHETELWYLEHYHNIYVHAVDGGDTVIFELKDGEVG